MRRNDERLERVGFARPGLARERAEVRARPPVRDEVERRREALQDEAASLARWARRKLADLDEARR